MTWIELLGIEIYSLASWRCCYGSCTAVTLRCCGLKFVLQKRAKTAPAPSSFHEPHIQHAAPRSKQPDRQTDRHQHKDRNKQRNCSFTRLFVAGPLCRLVLNHLEKGSENTMSTAWQLNRTPRPLSVSVCHCSPAHLARRSRSYQSSSG